ncbi:MAG: septal ring lytic transglycosylase RlpA family protein [Bdellovibrio bacteriovorus]
MEPLSRSGNPASYQVRGKRYFTKPTSAGHVERGLASWYGRQFHGRKTSSGERYNMYAMTAAHKTLPLPSYVRVTNMENGRSAVVKVNDRGPFHGPRVIDLSYSAAKKLGVINKGTAMVEVRAIDPANPASDPGPKVAAQTAAAGALKQPKAAPPSIVPTEPGPRAVPSPVTAAVATDAPAPSADGVKERGLEAALTAVAATPVAPPATSVPEPATSVAGPAPGLAAAAAGPDLYLQVGAFGDPSNAERLRKRLVANLSEQVRVQRSATGEAALYKVRIGPLGSEGQARAVSAKLVTLGVDQPRRVWN